MLKDPEAKLQYQESGRARIVARFRRSTSLQVASESVREYGAFFVRVEGDPPSTRKVSVLFRTARRGEQFTARILSWSGGNVALQPKLSVDDFCALVASVQEVLEEEEGTRTATREISEEAIRAFPTSEISPSAFDSMRGDTSGPLAVDQATSGPLEADLTSGPIPLEQTSGPLGFDPTSDPLRLDTSMVLQLGSSQPLYPDGDTGKTDAPRRAAGPDAEEEWGDLDIGAGDEADSAGEDSTLDALISAELQRANDGGLIDTAMGEGGDGEHWHRVRTGQTRVQPSYSPQARPGDFRPPDQAEPAFAAHTVSELEEPDGFDESKRHLDPPLPTTPDVGLDLMGAHAFLNHLDRDDTRLIDGDGVPGRSAVSHVARAAEWRPGAVLIANDGATGRRWYLFTQGGKVVNAYRLPPVEESAVGPRLAARGVVTHSGVAAALDEARAFGLSEEVAISRLQLVDSETLAAAVVERVRWVTGELLTAPKVSFKLYRLHRFPRQLRLGSTEVDKFTDLAKRFEELSQVEAQRLREPRLTQYPRLRARGDLLAQTLNLSPGDEGIMHRMRGSRTLGDLLADESFDRDRLFAVVFALAEMGLLEFDALAGRTTIEETGDSPASSSAPSSELGSLVASRQRMGPDTDHFEYLGLSWWAAGGEVDRAIAHFEHVISPQNLVAANAELEGKANLVLTRARSAAAALKSREGRARAREGLLNPEELASAARLLEAQAVMANARQDGRRASRLLERVRELDGPRATRLEITFVEDQVL